MYKHQVIDDFKYILNNPNKLIPGLEKEYLDFAPECINALEKAESFHFGPAAKVENLFADLMGTRLFQEKTAIDVRTPYPIMWFDYYEDRKIEPAIGEGRRIAQQSTKRGILIRSYLFDGYEGKTEKTEVLTMLPILYLNDIKRWLPSPLIYAVSPGNSYSKELFSLFLSCDILKKPMELEGFQSIAYKSNDYSQWSKSFGGVLPIARIRSLCSNGTEVAQQIKEDTPELSFVNFGLMLLNSKNIGTEKILNIKRRNKKKTQIASYHVLTIDLPGKNKKQTSSGSGGKNQTRFHLCRGHFKTYTTEAPLFGHTVGRIWCPSHAKGNREKGFITKDYNVKCKKERLQ